MSENRMLTGVSVRRNVVAEVVGRQSDPEKRVLTLQGESYGTG